MTENSDAQIRYIHATWHQANRDRDLSLLVSLYAEDATFESPAVYALNGKGEGVIKGRAAIHSFFETFFSKLNKDVAQWFRTDEYFSNGKILVWEYPRQTPTGDQTDLIESMDIENGLIVRHRVYWGWIGFRTILKALGVSIET